MYSYSEDEIENFCHEAYQNQRRLCRLYGSNKKDLKPSKFSIDVFKKKENDIRPSSSQGRRDQNPDEFSSVSKTKPTIQKFFERQLNEMDVQIHADNFNISQPWFVGYQNSTSSQGSPLSLAARYGYNGAIKISKAARRQEDIGVISGQARLHQEQHTRQKSDVEDPSKYQKKNKCNIKQRYEDTTDTKQLDRAVTREYLLWKGIMKNAKNERNKDKRRLNRSKEVKLSKYCPRSIHLKRSCVSSHKVFSMG